jgi:ElaB/YqjD/DUF883 family membrane-anchored ribosome-binding protein
MDKPIEADVQALAEEVKQLRAQIDKIVGILGQTARHGGDEAFRQAREAGERAWGDAKSTADDVIHRIEAKPVQSALAAFGIGLLLGLIFAGRR